MNLELALVGLYLSGHICPLSMLRVSIMSSEDIIVCLVLFLGNVK